jgi:hypothetical protein
VNDDEAAVVYSAGGERAAMRAARLIASGRKTWSIP